MTVREAARGIVKRVPVLRDVVFFILMKFRRLKWLLYLWNKISGYGWIDIDLFILTLPNGGPPYFGPALKSLQGSARRHFYMQKTLEVACGPQSENRFIKILEIGSWAGASAITFGKYLKSHNNGRGVIVCVDFWEPYLRDIDTMKLSGPFREMTLATKNNRILDLFLYNIRAAGLSNIVIPIKGLSKNAIPLLGEKFDYAFIDGSHIYKDVIQDIRMVIPLIKEGGVFSGDDLEQQLNECDPAFLTEDIEEECVIDPKTGVAFHPGVTRAVAEVFGEVSSWEGHWAMKKTANGWEKINLSFSEEEVVIPDHLKQRG